MMHEATSEFRIICAEERKSSRTTAVVSSWTEDQLVVLAIEKRNLKTDKVTRLDVEIDPAQLIKVLSAAMSLAPKQGTDGEQA